MALGDAREGRRRRPTPAPVEHVNLGSATTDTTITSDNIGTLNGSRLQFNPARADEGIFYVPTGGGAAIKVANANVQKNKPGQLVYLNPAAGPGFPASTYFLEVPARIDGMFSFGRAGWTRR